MSFDGPCRVCGPCDSFLRGASERHDFSGATRCRRCAALPRGAGDHRPRTGGGADHDLDSQGGLHPSPGKGGVDPPARREGRDGRLPGRGAAREDSQRNDSPGQVRQRDDQEPDDRLSGLPAVRRGVDPERRAGRRMGRGDRRRLRRSRGRLAHSGLRQGHGGARESHAHGRREDRADGAEALLGHGRQEPEGKGWRRGGVVVRLRDVWRHAVNRHPGACRLPGGLRELPRRKRDRLLHARFQRLP